MSNLIYQKSLKVCFILNESFGIEEENECDLDALIEQKKREQEAKNRMFSIILGWFLEKEDDLTVEEKLKKQNIRHYYEYIK